MCVETGVGWLVPRQWFDGDVGTGSATPPMSCAFPVPAPSDRQTEARHSLAVAPGAGSDPAVLWFREPTAASAPCFLCPARGFEIRAAADRRNSARALRTSVDHQRALDPRWPDHARCGNWPRNLLPRPPIK